MQVKLNMLNLVFNFYKTTPPRRGVLEKTGGEKHSKCRVFSSLLFPLFFKPNYALLAPKTPLFNGYFTLFGHVFMALKGFVYTIAAYIYT